MIIEQLCKHHINEIVRLAIDNYEEERSLVELPLINNASDIIYGSLSRLAQNGLGVAAVEQGKVVGYITGIFIEELFGRVSGIFCPIHAHGAIKQNRAYIYKKMYEKAAEIWVSKDIFTHAMAIYKQEQEVVDTFFWNGFGLRCIDAIRKVEVIKEKTNNYEIRRILPEEAEQIHGLELNLVKHLNSSPVFMPVYKELISEKLAKWLSEENNYIFAAFNGAKISGYIKLTEEGENFITSSPDMLNICGAYVIPEERGCGVAEALLAYSMDFLKEKGFCYCGVDFESLNPTASGFWMKHFEAYTCSVVRRIDERIKE